METGIDKIERFLRTLAGVSLTHDVSAYVCRNLAETKRLYGVCNDMIEAYDNGDPLFLVGQPTHSGKLQLYTKYGNSYTFAMEDVDKIHTDIETVISMISAQFGIAPPAHQKESLDKFLKRVEELYKRRYDPKNTFSSPFDEIIMSETFIEKGVFYTGGHFVVSKAYKTYTDKVISEDIDSEDILLYIPKDWVHFSGYDETFMLKWVSLIEELFSYKINFSGEKEFSLFKNNKSSKNFLTNNVFYTFELSGRLHYMHRYLIIILIRYLYEYGYNHIPGLTLRIINSIKNISFFKSLLLAHYSLDTSTVKGMPMAKGKNYNNYPYINTEFNFFLERLKYVPNLHTLPSVEIDKKTSEEFKEIFENSNYKRLLILANQFQPPKEDKKNKTDRKKEMIKPTKSDYQKFDFKIHIAGSDGTIATKSIADILEKRTHEQKKQVEKEKCIVSPKVYRKLY